jgi:DNA polymerase-4
VAPNKFLAKIASDWKKPNGLFVITPDQVEDFVSGLPVSKLHGVGKVTADKLGAGIEDACNCASGTSWRWCANSAVLVSDCGVWPVGLMTGWCITTVAASRSAWKTPTMSICRICAVAWQAAELLETLKTRMARIDSSYRAGQAVRQSEVS